MFLWPDSVKVNNHFILPDSWYSSDYALLIVNIFISEEFIQGKWRTIIKNSEKEEKFVTELTTTLGNINTTDISSKECLENIVQEYARILNSTWYKLSKNINITKHAKAWWNKEYSIKLNTYWSSKSLEDWKKFKGFLKKTICTFFNKKIQEITSKNRERLWDLMNYVISNTANAH